MYREAWIDDAAFFFGPREMQEATRGVEAEETAFDNLTSEQQEQVGRIAKQIFEDDDRVWQAFHEAINRALGV